MNGKKEQLGLAMVKGYILRCTCSLSKVGSMGR